MDEPPAGGSNVGPRAMAGAHLRRLAAHRKAARRIERQLRAEVGAEAFEAFTGC